MNIYEELGYLFIVSIIQLLLPLFISFIVTIFGYKYLKKYDEHTSFVIKPYYSSFLWALIIICITLIFNINIEGTLSRNKEYIIDLLDQNYWNLLPLFFLPSGIYWIIGSLIAPVFQLIVDISRPNHNEEIIKMMNKKQNIQDPMLIPYDYSKNIFICGKNGAGKTVAILNFIQHHIKNKEFCLIMDGKGDLGKYGLFDVCTKLAKKYNRPLYIINQSNPSETHAYNPFENCNATQIKDMLINMSAWSEEHYKALASEYWQAMAQFMIDYEEPINFNSLVEYSSPNYFLDVLNLNKDNLDKETYNYYRNIIINAGETVASAKSRFSTIAHGVGKQLFSTEHTFNLKQAYQKNAIVLVILNNLEYTDFARSVGRLVLDDIKNLVGGVARENTDHKQFLCVYDELSVYFDPMLVDIVNKSRSLGGCNILSTQTIADMDIISKDARRQIIGNMHGFYLLKQADDSSAETLARTIGTKKGTEITAKLDMFGKTGDGTSKIIDEFKLHPNDLKDLPLEVGYWIDTMNDKAKPIRTKMNYVDVSDIPNYKFNQLV